MSISIQKLGVQSWCFREFKDNQKVIELIKGLGLSHIELCRVHVDFTNESTFDPVIQLYRDHGMTIDSIGVEGISTDESQAKKLFEFAQRAGIKTFSVDFDLKTAPQCFRIAEKLAAQYGIRVAIHNHGGWHWLGCVQMLEQIFATTNDQIGLCLDTAWAMDSGEDPIQMIQKFSKRLYGIHIKDFVFDRARKPKDVVVGTGNLDLKKLDETLKQVNFNGYTILEYEGDVSNPIPALAQCIEALRKIS